MEIIYIYAMIGLSGAILAYYEIMRPIMTRLKNESPDNSLLKSPITTYILWFLGVAILIPAFTPVLLSDGLKAMFIKEFINAVKSDN